jgi:hypothetical protein
VQTRRGSPDYRQGQGFMAAIQTNASQTTHRRTLHANGAAAAADANMSTGMMGKVEARDDPGSRPNRPGHQGIQEAEQAHIGLITAASLVTVLAAGEGGEAAQGSRRVCPGSPPQNHDCCRREGRSPDLSWPLQWEDSPGRRRWRIFSVSCSATRKHSSPCPATAITAAAADATSAWRVSLRQHRRSRRDHRRR